jgi:hydrogenase maturation protease
VIGVGNLLLGDEGVGVHVARRLLERPERLPPGVRVVEAGTSILDCLGDALACSRVVVVDAMRSNARPGSIRRIGAARLRAIEASSRIGVSLHAWGVPQFATAIGLLSPAPPRLSLVGIEPARIEPRLGLSPPVARAAGRVVAWIREGRIGLGVRATDGRARSRHA